MPVVRNGEATAAPAQQGYSGPKITVVPFYRYPVYSTKEVEKKWWPGKVNENGGGVVCVADIHVYIEGLGGQPIQFNNAVISNSKNGGGLIALAEQSWDANAPNGKGGFGARKNNYDFGPAIAMAIRRTLKEGEEALTEEVLDEVYAQWEAWAGENDPELLDYYYEVVSPSGGAVAPPPPPPPARRPAARQAPVAPVATAPAVRGGAGRRTPAPPIATDEDTTYGEQDHPFAE